MAIIKKNELKQMDKKILNDKLIELRKELIKSNTQISTGTVPENPGRIREVKRTIAKIISTLDNKKKIEVKKIKKPVEVKKKE